MILRVRTGIGAGQAVSSLVERTEEQPVSRGHALGHRIGTPESNAALRQRVDVRCWDRVDVDVGYVIEDEDEDIRSLGSAYGRRCQEECGGNQALHRCVRDPRLGRALESIL